MRISKTTAVIGATIALSGCGSSNPETPTGVFNNTPDQIDASVVYCDALHTDATFIDHDGTNRGEPHVLGFTDEEPGSLQKLGDNQVDVAYGVELEPLGNKRYNVVYSSGAESMILDLGAVASHTEVISGPNGEVATFTATDTSIGNQIVFTATCHPNLT